jgi:hypothetical protein
MSGIDADAPGATRNRCPDSIVSPQKRLGPSGEKRVCDHIRSGAALKVGQFGENCDVVPTRQWGSRSSRSVGALGVLALRFFAI